MLILTLPFVFLVLVTPSPSPFDPIPSPEPPDLSGGVPRDPVVSISSDVRNRFEEICSSGLFSSNPLDLLSCLY